MSTLGTLLSSPPAKLSFPLLRKAPSPLNLPLLIALNSKRDSQVLREAFLGFPLPHTLVLPRGESSLWENTQCLLQD